MGRFILPPMVIGKANAAGDAGRRWLEDLDGIVAELEQMWKIKVGKALFGGSHALVGAAVGMDGTQYALKVDLPDGDISEFQRAAHMLAAADGRGYAKIYACDENRRAVLMERLGGTLREAGYPPERQMEIICGALDETWRIDPGAVSAQMPDGEASIAWFRRFIPDMRQKTGLPCGRIVDRALQYLAEREKYLNRDNWVILHGDAHNNNMLRVPGSGRFKLIDPEGVFYEREYDLGVLMREWPDEYAADPVRAGRERARFLSDLTGADEHGIWQWGFLQMVSTALILVSIGENALGRQMLRIAQAWCEE